MQTPRAESNRSCRTEATTLDRCDIRQTSPPQTVGPWARWDRCGVVDVLVRAFLGTGCRYVSPQVLPVQVLFWLWPLGPSSVLAPSSDARSL